jgi:hypothetical protein
MKKHKAKRTQRDLDIFDERHEKDNPADLRYDFHFVPFGYQVTVYMRGKQVGAECRDFGGNHEIVDVADALNREIVKVINRWRSRL